MTVNPPVPPPIPLRSQKRGPLAYSQESLWFLSEMDPSNNAYNSIYLFRLTGGVDHQIMERTLNEIVRRHGILRTTFPSRGGQPLESIKPYESFSLPYFDYSSLALEEREPAVRQYALHYINIPVNLSKGPLTRFALLHTSSHEDYLFFAIHHICFDAWSRYVLINELVQLYSSFHTGNDLRLPELPIQYIDYAIWQREWLSGDTLKLYINHWKDILRGELPVIDLPIDHPRPVLQTYHGARHFFGIQPALSDQVKKFCQKERLTPFHFFLAAFAILLMRYSGQEEVIIGCPFANRPRPELDGLIGVFINTLPIRLNLGGNPSVRSFLGQVREVMLDALSWQAVPFEALVSELSLPRDTSRTPVFQVLINMRNVPRRSRSIEGLNIEDILTEDIPAAFDLYLELGDEESKFNAAIRYNTDLFDRTTILNLVSHFQNILSAMLAEPERQISELGILTSAERQRLLVDWNENQLEYSPQCVHELISVQAAKNPDAPAVICNGRELTYSSLEQRSNQLAAYLLTKGVKPGTLVGLFLPRSEDVLIALLAILKAGGAYVPFDLTYPDERQAFMFQDANPSLVITNSSLESKIPNQILKIFLDSDAATIQACYGRSDFNRTNRDSLLYVTYTSGSTGRPKGVMNTQGGVLNYLNYLEKNYHLKAGERIIQFTPFSFDAAFRDSMGVLTFGGTVVLLDDEQMRDPDFIYRALVDQEITCVLSIVPTMLRALARSAPKNRVEENHLRLIMPSGEVLQTADIELVRNAFGRAVQIVNQFGPTECSMISTHYSVPNDLPVDIQNIPIGKPINNVSVYVLDQFRHPVPVGVKGELYIGGVGVGAGYLNKPSLTDESFCSDPSRRGGRMYRTGDLVRFSPDGTLYFLGRLDHQIKFRGYRVELGEIEAVIGEYPNIQAVAVVFSQKEGLETLSAYITLNDGEQVFSTEILQQYLKDRLPFYMLPSGIMILKEMPLTPNRKIDRRALPLQENGKEQHQYLAPRNDIEKRMASIWKEVLGVERVGVRDNFFELGGHSLLAVHLFARIREEFDQSLPLLLLFKDGTVEGLSISLKSQGETSSQNGVTPIQPEGSGIPIFFLSAGLYMRDLAFALGTTHPVYGLHPSENGQLLYRGSIQEMVKIHYQCLIDFFPQGPYLLIGHSSNGLYALELARLLRKEGKKVAFLGLLDTYPPRIRREASRADRLKIHLNNIQDKNFHGILTYAGLSLQRLTNRWWRAVVGIRAIELYERKGNVKEVKKLILRAYKPEPYDGKVTLFTATQRPFYVRSDLMEQWTNIFTGPFEIIPIRGDHMSILEPPQVTLLADKILSMLNSYESE